MPHVTLKCSVPTLPGETPIQLNRFAPAARAVRWPLRVVVPKCIREWVEGGPLPLGCPALTQGRPLAPFLGSVAVWGVAALKRVCTSFLESFATPCRFDDETVQSGKWPGLAQRIPSPFQSQSIMQVPR